MLSLLCGGRATSAGQRIQARAGKIRMLKTSGELDANNDVKDQ